VEDIEELRTSGLSITAISQMTGYDRKTIRKHLLGGTANREYGPRPPRPGKLENFKPYIQDRLQAGVWNAVVLLREIRERGYAGGYGTVKEFLQPQREAARTVAVRRFETAPGKQAQVDWGHLGTVKK
jgi:transposase